MHLLFTGCSFVAGDALAWDLFYPNENWSIHSPYQEEYAVKRRPYTLAARCAQLVGADTWTDISRDGMSNMAIAHHTLDWLSRNPHDDLVVCVGWTEPIRRMVWDGFWINMSVHALTDDPRLPREFRQYIESAIVLRSEEDHQLDYLTSVYLLNNWLAAHGVRSVQWRSMGEPFTPPPGLALPSTQVTGQWLTPPQGPSWHTLMQEADRCGPDNLHPNRVEVARHAARIARMIKA
jgi:hypothetical protein